MTAGNDSTISLALLAKATVESTFSEMCRPCNHTGSFILACTAFENYFKKRLFEIDYKIVFPKAESKNKLGNSIGISEIPVLVDAHLNYTIDKKFHKEIVKKKERTFSFSRSGDWL